MRERADQLADWLSSRIREQGWSLREAARRSGLSPTLVSDVVAGRVSPGFDFCVAMARALDLPAEDLLRRAGLLPEPPGFSPLAGEILELFAKLSAEDQQELIEIARLKLARIRRGQRARK